MKVWVYIDGRQQGPFEKEQLRGLPGFNENTKVWFEGLPKWYPAGSLDELASVFLTEEPGAAAEEERTVCEESAEVREERPAQEHRRYAPGAMYFRKNAVALDEPCPPTYIGLSIFLMICCCSPISLAALIASICVSTFYAKGNLASSKKASEVAAWLIMAAIALGFFPVMLMSTYFG